MAESDSKITYEDLTPGQKMRFNAVIRAYKEAVLTMPRQSGKTTLTKVIINELRKLDK